MSETLTVLAQAEERLPNLVFSKERSPVNELNNNFASFGEKDFLDWLDDFSKREVPFRVLEIGGGVDLVAARELLERYPNLLLTEVEKRQVDSGVKKSLTKSGRCLFYQNGFSEVINLLEKDSFEIVFLHNVLPHLPDPFFIIEECFKLLKSGGLLFVNGILIYEEEWEKIVEYLNREGYSFSFTRELTPSSLQKKGIISVSFTLQKNQNDFNLPLREGDFLTDFEGNTLAVKEIFFEDLRIDS